MLTPSRLAALLLLAHLAACGTSSGNGLDPDAGDGSGADTGAGDVATDVVEDTGPDLAPCDDNFDCRGGEVCRGEVCREACASNDPCTGPLPTCDDAAGFCVACLQDNDCPTNRICVGRSCEFFCVDDMACPSGERCNATTGECVEPECERDADCPGGFACRAFVCSPIDEQICTPETSSCRGNTVLTCSRDGTQLRTTQCDTDSVCVTLDATSAECRPQFCSPDSIGCIDSGTAFVCDSTGTELTRIPCGAGQFCADGECAEQSCTPGVTRCLGDSLATCDSLGATETVVACDDTPACTDAQFGCRCTSGECFARRCSPGATRCVGSGYQECDAEGANWGTVESCPDGTSCRDGACR